ncbi:MAG: CTP synthase [Patescibacteria group bacterium]|nr:CTP synthase [Patescibacteria group bacterium]
MAKKTKFIFISGGVISGLGKGITTASIALLLESRGIKTAPIKCDTYMNIDAGTIRPQEHGEVFVTDDAVECDQDLGNYERFLNRNLSRANYLTNGQVYNEIIKRERSFQYQGEDVEIVPHVPEEMIRRFKLAGQANNAEVVLIEIGGTVGEYQNVLFIEANRIMKYRDKEDTLHIHLGYLPTPSFLGEMKSKPVQNSVRILSGTGIQPDFIIGRAEKNIDEKRKERIAWLCNIDKENIISDPDTDPIYKIPSVFKKQGLDTKIMQKFQIKSKKNDFGKWQKLLKTIDHTNKIVKIALVGKYFSTGEYVLPDVYISVIEAIKHAAWAKNAKAELTWIDSETYEKNPHKITELKKFDGVVVPGGFGKRGVEGIIKAIQFTRENKIPFLGLCYGLQMATIEFARNICNLKNANSTEVDPKTKYPVIDLMETQVKNMNKKLYGGTMRLGAYPCKIKPKGLAHMAYDKLLVSERHRHRYEVNNKYRQKLSAKGLIFSGTSPDNNLVEIIELNKKDHPFFMATQFHPEFLSRPLSPHPLFREFIRTCCNL